MGEENISNAFEYFNPSPSGAFMDKLMEMRMSAPNDKAKRAVDKMIDGLEN